MNLIKKITTLAITAAIMASQLSVFAAFNDMPDGEIGEALQAAVDNGLIAGIDDNTIAPNDLITRAQMATIITRAFGAIEKSDKSFPDVASDAWYADSVKKAVAMSAFEGDDAGMFNPENNITFQETYTVLARVFYFEPYTMKHKDGSKTVLHNISISGLNAFGDYSDIASWASSYAACVVQNGGWKGINGMLKPTSYITRGEFALVMNSLVKTYIDKPGTYDNLPNGTTVVRSSGVTVNGLKSSGNLIISYSVDKDGCMIENADITGATIILGGANPTEVTDEKTNQQIIKASTTPSITLTGSYNDILIRSPYVTADVTNLKATITDVCKNSIALVGQKTE